MTNVNRRISEKNTQAKTPPLRLQATITDKTAQSNRLYYKFPLRHHQEPARNGMERSPGADKLKTFIYASSADFNTGRPL